MYLNRFLLLLILSIALSYECLFVEGKYNLNCLANLGDLLVKSVAKCEDEACVNKGYQIFNAATKLCYKYDYKLCYQRPNKGAFVNCTSEPGEGFFNLKDCESSPGSGEYKRKKCIPYAEDCFKVMCG
ncbi:uncharacterized protein BX664DRAFT_369224 [Halteromyces radiatus]|uniref:uncharacterized protein n=1 Tax=Halteromyces radiatus TaxID=101107 RepID=UPI002220FBED|nr:uncharacterized protein BX664DRAFT_369224 [Halteromyces radiatus]KAI8078805.1 hypothetical protein BX664DRAFT_369224 [Halteromyces radiatus]